MSYIKLPKDKVIEACKRTLATYEQIRRKEETEFIESHRRNISTGWFKPKRRETFEEAKERLDKYGIGCEYDMFGCYPSVFGKKWTDITELLMRMCDVTVDDYVLVSYEHFEAIDNHYK